MKNKKFYWSDMDCFIEIPEEGQKRKMKKNYKFECLTCKRKYKIFTWAYKHNMNKHENKSKFADITYYNYLGGETCRSKKVSIKVTRSRTSA